jgi:hypothetical protein
MKLINKNMERDNKFLKFELRKVENALISVTEEYKGLRERLKVRDERDVEGGKEIEDMKVIMERDYRVLESELRKAERGLISVNEENQGLWERFRMQDGRSVEGCLMSNDIDIEQREKVRKLYENCMELRGVEKKAYVDDLNIRSEHEKISISERKNDQEKIFSLQKELLDVNNQNKELKAKESEYKIEFGNLTVDYVSLCIENKTLSEFLNSQKMITDDLSLKALEHEQNLQKNESGSPGVSGCVSVCTGLTGCTGVSRCTGVSGCTGVLPTVQIRESNDDIIDYEELTKHHHRHHEELKRSSHIEVKKDFLHVNEVNERLLSLKGT